MEEHPQTIDALKQRIDHARAELQALVDSVTDEQLQARQNDQWSIADHLAHLAAWERGVAAYLQGRPRATAMGLTEATWGISMDEMNARIFQQHSSLTAEQARRLLDEAQEQMNKALDSLSDDDLVRDYGELLPDGLESPYSERTVLHTIGANTYAHYEEHAQAIRQKLSARR